MMRNKILLVGNGLISNRVKGSTHFKNYDLLATTRRDVRTEAEYFLDFGKSDDVPDEVLRSCENILIMAGITSPDECEYQYENAYRVNVVGTKDFIERCLHFQCRVIFFSSDAVYGEIGNICNEESVLEPLGKYGEMKKEIELEFRRHDMFKALRLSYVFSPQDKFVQYLRRSIENSSIAHVFSGFKRSVVWIDDVIEVIFKLIHKWDNVDYKIINVGGSELLGREDLARMYKERVNQTLQYTVEDPPDGFFDFRARVVEINVGAMKDILGRPPELIKNVITRT